MNSVHWLDAEQAHAELNAAGWQWLVRSGRAVNEERAQWGARSLPGCQRIGMERAELNAMHRFKMQSPSREAMTVAWQDLGTWLGQEIKPGDKVLIDMCLLGFDAVLYLLPALLQINLSQLAVLYVAPLRYVFPEDPMADLLLLPIQQPKAYVASLSHDAENPQTRHLVFLGFDHARAWKFIDARAWKLQNVHVALGDPPFVTDGVRWARLAAEPWLPIFESAFPEQLHLLAANEPQQTARLCAEMLAQSQWLDIVPIGPKPMNLGVLWFYFSLPEDARAQVRLLYDFPQQQQPRSSGIGAISLFDCSHLLKVNRE